MLSLFNEMRIIKVQKWSYYYFYISRYKFIVVIF